MTYKCKRFTRLGISNNNKMHFREVLEQNNMVFFKMIANVYYLECAKISAKVNHGILLGNINELYLVYGLGKPNCFPL